MLNLSHKKLNVYNQALNLVKGTYFLTEHFPQEEKYGLTTQLRRAIISVCSNLAEGAARRTPVEQARFYEIARSSLVEVDTQIEISLLLGFAKSSELKEFENGINEVFAMLSKLISACRK